MTDFVNELDPLTVAENSIFSMSLECSFCGITYEEDVGEMQDRDEMAVEFVKILEEAGWADLESDEHMAVGFACPDCITQEKHWRIANESE